MKYKVLSTKYSFLVFWIIFANELRVQAQTYTEAEIKSAFICNFIKFTEWPAAKFSSDTSSIVIGLLGQDPFGEALLKVARVTQVGKHKVRLVKVNSIAECKELHALYFGLVKDNNYKVYIEECIKYNILSISEYPDFTSLGGIINFAKIRNSRYGFQISTKNADLSRLILSAKLLKLAELKD